ncbi:MAG: PAS domain-containing protein, partial [Chloroflexales bacterium]|nr:PAS domain-containing protein [Chloroflexales bacterium]
VLLRARDEQHGWLLVARVAGNDGAGQADSPGTVYTVLNIAEELGRIRRDLQLSADMQLVSGGAPVVSTLGAAPLLKSPKMQFAINGMTYRAAWHTLQLGARPIELAVLRSEATIDATVSSGLRAMLISSGLTLVLLASCGVWVASSITRPILHLGRVAREVAAGNLSSKAGLRQRDEVGQLGRALDQATTTISSLLDQQAQITGERQAILHSIADGVLAVDRDQRIVLVNPAAVALLGLADQAVQRQPLAELARSPDPTIGAGVQLLVELIQASLDGGAETHGEQRVVLGQRVVRVHSAPVVGGAQRNGAVVVLQDVTRAVEADRAKSEFIAVASHELRTPLTGLKGFVDLFALDGVAKLTRMQHECLGAIRRQTDNLVLLVNDLLEMARLEQGARAERKWVSPAQAIDEVLVGVQVQASAKRLRVERVISPELPPLWIDERHLHRILSNLVSNAVKYTPDGGRVALHVYALEDPARLPAALAQQPWPHHGPESLVFAVEDTGVGIRSDDQDRIFSRFFRSANALSVEAGGTGLGLAISQALVALHGGQIGFHSVEGRGSCFWVRLPVQLTAAIATALPVEEL